MKVIAIKYAREIVKEIRERGSTVVPAECITGDTFEEWLRKEKRVAEPRDIKGTNKNTGAKENLARE